MNSSAEHASSEHSSWERSPAVTATGFFVGRSVLDVLQLVEAPAPADGKIRSLQHTIAAGGPATNAAVLFAALGGQAQLLSRVAQDPLGQALRTDLERHGRGRLQHHDIWDPSDTDFVTVPSAISVTASNGDRSAVAGSPHSAANTGTPDPTFDALLTSDMGVLLVDSDETDISRSLTWRARELGIPTVLDVGAEKEVTQSQLPGIDSAIVAEDFHDASPDDIIDHLAARGVPYGAVTCGADPLRHFSPEGRGWITPAKVDSVVDTLGAGDFFHGAYCYAIARSGLSPGSHVAALEWACLASALSIQHFGTRTWLAHLDELPPPP